jgi:hypothetical protein
VTWVGSCEHELVPNGWWLPASMDHPCDTEAVVHVADTEPFSSVFSSSSSYRRPRAGLSAQEARLDYDVAAWPPLGTRYIKKIHSVVQIGYGYPQGNGCPHNSCLRASPRVFFCLLPLSLCLFRRRHGTTVSVVTSSPPAVEHRESVLQLPSSCLQAAAPSSFSCRCRYWTAWGGDRFRFASISSFSW